MPLVVGSIGRLVFFGSVAAASATIAGFDWRLTRRMLGRIGLTVAPDESTGPRASRTVRR